MPSLYPAATDDSTSLPDPSASNTTQTPSHAGLHANTNGAVKAIESKLGTGASTPTNNTLLRGNGTGSSSWSALTSAQLAASLTDETGTGQAVFATTPTLVTPKIDTINENTATNGVTIDGLNIKDGALNSINAVGTAAIQSNAVTADKVAIGTPVQVASTNYSAVSTTTAIIPFDDTIPQITEGTEFMTCTITPKSATNRLVIDVLAYGSTSSVGEFSLALFQDAIANALTAGTVTVSSANYLAQANLRHDMVAGTTASITFRVRIGSSNGSTTTFNGVSAARRFGGITLSNIRVIEYKA